MKSNAEKELEKACQEKGLILQLVKGITVGNRRVYAIRKIGADKILEANTLKHLSTYVQSYSPEV